MLQNEFRTSLSTLRSEVTKLESGHILWLEPVRKWISTARSLAEIARTGTPEQRRALAVEVFGSNLTLDGQKLSGAATKPWDAIPSFNASGDLVTLYAAVRTAFGIPE